jgi:hypothetical protein
MECVSDGKFDYRFMTVTMVTKYTIRHRKSLRFVEPYFHEIFSCTSVDIATGYGVEGQGSTQSPIQWVPAQFLSEIKPPGCEADQSPNFKAEIKKGQTIPPLPNMSSCHNP